MVNSSFGLETKTRSPVSQTVVLFLTINPFYKVIHFQNFMEKNFCSFN